MSIIFGYEAHSRVFNIYASWVACIQEYPKNEMPELLLYTLETTFFHTFPCVDGEMSFARASIPAECGQ